MRLHRDMYVKDLSKIGRDLSKTLILDNLAENFVLQEDNGIEIKTWTADPDDKEFFTLAPFLVSLVTEKVPDVRVEIKKLKTTSKN